MLRSLHAFAGQHALALIVNLQHVEFRFRLRPPEHNLENVRDVGHEIDRVVPADDQVTGLQLALVASLFFFLDVRQYHRFNRFSHAGKVFENGPNFNFGQ